MPKYSRVTATPSPIFSPNGRTGRPSAIRDPTQAFIAPYAAPQGASRFVEQIARHVANLTEWKTLRFLTALNREIYECCGQIPREHGQAQPADETLQRKRGSSRDLAVLFVEACR